MASFEESRKHSKETERLQKIILSMDLQELPEEIPVFGTAEDKWLAPQEIVLLTSIQHYSYGNWNLHADILTHIFKKKFTAEEVEEHYNSMYLDGDLAEAMKEKEDSITDSCVIDHTTMEDVDSLNSSDMNAYENVPAEFLTLLGYMPLREEFEVEFEQTAEDLIRYSDFFEKEEYDKNVNLILLDTYRIKLQERIIRRNDVKEFRIVERFYAKHKASFEKSQHQNPRVQVKKQQQNREKRVPPISESEEEEETPRKRHKAKHLQKHKIKKTVKLISLHYESENDSNEGDKEENSTLSINIDDYPYAEHLSEDEKKLCVDLGLKPVYYIYYKAFLKYLDLEKTEGRHSEKNVIPAHMTLSQCFQIVDLLEKSGFLENKNLLNIIDI